MRLILAQKVIQEQVICFQEFHRRNAPEYAVLSHAWEEGHEVTYDDCNYHKCNLAPTSKRGYGKIWNTCRLAIEDGIEYVWIDTCCIDKSSSAELTESINSMFKWYGGARVCYAYLSDLDVMVNLKDCRWFRRGWTLQELIAPKSVKFFNGSWKFVGNKHSLLGQLSTITKIDEEILVGTVPVSSACVARRFSWAANRETTRDEDIAYCLLGIFDINMPLLYGEGEKAFIRLQEEIIRSTPDLSIFAWTVQDESKYAKERYCGFLAVPIRMIGPDIFARSRCHGVFKLVPVASEVRERRTITLLTKMPSMPPDLSISEAQQWRSDIVPVNRFIAVRMELVSSFGPIKIMSMAPRKYWDLEDCTFFYHGRPVLGWGVLLLDCDALFIFFWFRGAFNNNDFEGTLLNAKSKVGRVLARELIFLAEKLDYEPVDMKELLQTNGVKYEDSVQLKHRGLPIQVSFKAKEARDVDVCRGLMWKVEIRGDPLT